MLETLLYLIAITVVLQPNRKRLAVACIYAVALFWHHNHLGHLDGFVYYGSAAAFDITVITILGVLPVTALSVRLQLICLFSVLGNFYGWVIWYAGISPASYNVAFIVLYGVAVLALLKRDKNDARDNKFYWGLPGICGVRTSQRVHSTKYAGAL